MTITTKRVLIAEKGGPAAGEEEEVGGAAAFGRQSATPAVRRRVALRHTTLASDTTGMREGVGNSLNSRDVCNASTPGFNPHPKTLLSFFVFLLFPLSFASRAEPEENVVALVTQWTELKNPEGNWREKGEVERKGWGL
ncbi:hypothetical protein E2542_SST28973 [Spatholobus suberectus]|nr:hypothetical protein E2542_SST28973 [Spatholobus suberectus]